MTTPTTLNPSDKDAHITLSNGNLTMTNVGAGGVTWESVRATVARTTGQYVFEVSGTTGAWAAGVMAAGHALSSNAPGSASDPAATVFYDGNVGFNGSVGPPATILVPLAGVPFLVVVDLDARTIGLLANSRTTGSVSFATLTGPVYPFLSGNASPGPITVNFGASPFVNKIPPGYQSWDGAQQGSAATTAYSKYRLYVTANGLGTQNETDVGELQLWSGAIHNGINRGLTANATWTNDSAFNGTNTAAKLGDGSNTTANAWWSAATALPHWAEATPVAGAVPVLSVGIGRVNVTNDFMPKDFIIQGWTGTAWVNLKAVTGFVTWVNNGAIGGWALDDLWVNRILAKRRHLFIANSNG